MPEAVSTSTVGDMDKPDEILTIDTSMVNALVIKAIQEMDAKYQAKIDALTKELAELKATK